MGAMGRLKGLIAFIGGLVLVILGIGMWRSPEIDWEGFLEAWSVVIDDIARLIHDPFAVFRGCSADSRAINSC